MAFAKFYRTVHGSCKPRNNARGFGPIQGATLSFDVCDKVAPHVDELQRMFIDRAKETRKALRIKATNDIGRNMAPRIVKRPEPTLNSITLHTFCTDHGIKAQ